jgi:hypothetical protein
MNVESIGESKIKGVLLYYRYPTPRGCMGVECRKYEDNDVYGIPLCGIGNVHFVRTKIPLGGIDMGL